MGRLRRILSTAWLTFGLACLGLLMLEVAYRVQKGVRGEIHAGVAGPSPRSGQVPGYVTSFFADSAWWPEFLREQAELRPHPARWEPFVYWRMKPYAGRYINSDSAGLRITPRYANPKGLPIRVFFFGGSTTWGLFERDSLTRPALVAKRLEEAGFDPQVTNFGQLAYVSSQELITFVLELRRGNIPDVAVFWDGENDVLCGVEDNTASGTCAFEDRAAYTPFGTADPEQVSMDVALHSLLGHISFVQRLKRFLPKPARPPLPPRDGFCRAVTMRWLGEARLLDKLAEAYHFVALAIWQPTWATSERPRTAYERALLARPDRPAGLDPFFQACARMVDSLSAAHAAQSMFTLSTLHANDSGTVFLDPWGHTPERVIQIQADTLAKVILAHLPARLRPRR
jgi:hypothetical protein